MADDFSKIVQSFFQSLLDTSISEDFIIGLLRTTTSTDFIRYALYRQSPDRVEHIVELVATGIEKYLSGSLQTGVRSDILFYATSHYILWTFRADRGCQQAKQLRHLLRQYWSLRSDASKLFPKRFTEDSCAPWW